ncbi:MAG: hypothetical protein Q4C70_14170 [Planctomycetia bacterium]|nr:hypothetical protein [Planctomycetia bacterium]
MSNTSTTLLSASLLEYAQAGNSTRLDRERGLLTGVKILGLSSLNSRKYAPSALQNAQSLYENAKVNVNHPDTPCTPRDYQDRIGSIRNVHYRENDGLYADFHFNPHHPLAEQFMWDAEHAPENVGFSHNILARTAPQQDGTLLVEEITKVRSVDLVADPATTHGLFESQNPQNTPKTQLSENFPSDFPVSSPVNSPVSSVSSPTESVSSASVSESNFPKNSVPQEVLLTEALQQEIRTLQEDLHALRDQFRQLLQHTHQPTEPVSHIPEKYQRDTHFSTEDFVKCLRK